MLLLVSTVVMAICLVDLSTVQREHFMLRRGDLAGTIGSKAIVLHDSGVTADIVLESTSDLRVQMRLFVPEASPVDKLPLVVLLGGHRTGRFAVDLIDRPDEIAFAAIDYPYDGRQALSGATQIAAAVPVIQDALLDTPAALMLAMDWLSEQDWFDAQRADLVGISLGVPFAAVAGALDTRFSRVWLIHGASDNLAWINHAARDRVEHAFLRRIAARTALFIAYGNSFDTTSWIREIAPRPLVIIVAEDDERVPRNAIQGFIDSASNENVSLRWTRGQHIGHGRDRELEQLIEIVKLEVLSQSAGQATRVRP